MAGVKKIKYLLCSGFVPGLIILFMVMSVFPGKTDYCFSQEENPTPKGQRGKVIKSAGKKGYHGKPGNFNFQKADLKNVLLFFAKTYKLNIVIGNGVNGSVTCRLINVPWDQALDVILKMHGMVIVKAGKNLTIRKL